jgi:hypothetical protein
MGKLRYPKVAEVRNCLARHPRYHVHFMPTCGSWLNLVERLFAELTERCVRRGSHTAVRVLEKAMLDYLDQRNRNPKPFVSATDSRARTATSSEMQVLATTLPMHHPGLSQAPTPGVIQVGPWHPDASADSTIRKEL